MASEKAFLCWDICPNVVRHAGLRQLRSIRVIRIVPNAEAQEEVRKHIVEMAAATRIRVEPVVIVADDVAAAIQSALRDASVVFFGFETPAEGEEATFFEHMETIAGSLPRVLFVNSVGGVELGS